MEVNIFCEMEWWCKVNSVQEACAKCFVVHILKFEILQITWKKWNKEQQTLSFQFFTNTFSILMFFVLIFHVVCKISNLIKWIAKHLSQASCTELTLKRSKMWIVLFNKKLIWKRPVKKDYLLISEKISLNSVIDYGRYKRFCVCWKLDNPYWRPKQFFFVPWSNYTYLNYVTKLSNTRFRICEAQKELWRQDFFGEFQIIFCLLNFLRNRLNDIKSNFLSERNFHIWWIRKKPKMSIIALERRDVSDRGPSLYYVSKFLEFFLPTHLTSA